MANVARVTQSVIEAVTLQSGTARLTQSVIEYVVGLGVICNNPPAGSIGTPYTHTFIAGSGTPPYTFTISGGSLPTGLSMDGSGNVTGTPTSAGSSTFTVTVTDSILSTASVTCSILINSRLISAPISPGGGPYILPKPCLCDVSDLAMKALMIHMDRKGEWPYPWLFGPPGAIRVTAQDVIAVPTVAAGETVGLTYTVPQGFTFALSRIVVEPFAGSVNPGDFLWSLDLNAPEAVPTFQGAPIQGLTLVDVPLGNLEFPWPLSCPEIFNPNDTIRAKFRNVNLAPGAPNLLKTILLGWIWPVNQ